MKPLPALATVYRCYRLHPNAVVEAWEPADRYGDTPPNRIGCYECGRMVRVDWEDD